MDDAIGHAEAMLGLDGFRVLNVDRTPAEMTVTIETTAEVVGCSTCGVRAEAQDRLRVDIRDLPCFGRTVRLVWMKRRWRCADPDCLAKTWTEDTEHVAPRAVLTLRAGAEATRQVGELAMPVAMVARELSVCWWTVMNAVVLHGTPLVDDPKRVGKVKALGIDETTFLSANRERSTVYATGMVDLERRKIIDMVEETRHLTCADGVPPRIRRGSLACGWWRRTWPRATGQALPPPRPCRPGSESVSRGPGGQPVRRQGAPAGPRTRHWATGAGSTTRSIGSGSSC